MAISLLNLRSLTPGIQPQSLEPSQLCFNLPDRIIFVGDGSDFKTDFNGNSVPGTPGLGWFSMSMNVAGLGESFLVSPDFYGQSPTNGQIVQWNSALGHLEWVDPSATGSDSAGYLTDNTSVAAATGTTVSEKLNAVIAPATAEEGNTAIVQGVSGDLYEGVYTFIQGTWEFGSFYAPPVAAAVAFDNAGTTLTATDVQGALVELDTEKVQSPAVPASAGQVLGWNGAATEWVSNSVGSVVSVTGTSPIAVDNTDPVNPVVSVNAASTTAAGVAQLNDTTSSTSATEAATANAVRSAYDLANTAEADAQQALADAAAAQSTANTAVADATQALTDAAAAQLDATQALSDAAGAQTDATQALTDAAAAQATADAALPKAGGTMTGIISFSGTQPTATILAANIVQLEDSTSSNSITTAATPNSVRAAYDLANAALPLTGGTMTGAITFDPSQVLPINSIQGASTTQVGVVQLEDSVVSTSNSTAATPNSVKTAYDAAVAAQSTADDALPLAGGTMTGVIVFDAGQTFPVIGIQDASPTQKGVVQVGTNIGVTAGVINIADGNTTAKGVVQLTDALNSTSTTLGLSANAGYQLQQQIDTLSILANLTFCGTVNADTGLLTSVTDAGIIKGFTVGSPLPSPAATTTDHFVVVSVPGTFTPTGGAAPFACNQGDWILGLEPNPGVYEWSLQPVGYDAPAANETEEGVVYLATNAEVQAGTDTSNKAVNPASLQSKLSDAINLASSTTIASSQAVKDVYDAALSAQADADQALLDAAAAQATADQAVLDAASAQATADAAMPISGGTFTGPVTFPAGFDIGAATQITYDNASSGLDATDVQEAIDELAGREEVIFYESFGSLPAVGLNDVLYVVKDTDTIYRGATGPASYDFTVGPTGDFPDLPTALASASVVDGTTLGVQAGTYTLSSTLTINKQVQIFGEDKNTVILQSEATTSAPTTLISVTVDNVVLKGLTISHRKTSNTSVETAVSASGAGFPQTRVDNFILDDCIIRHIEFGVIVRGSNWKLSNSSYVYAGPNNSTRRHVGIYGVSGDCFAVGNTSNEDVVPGTTGNTRWFSMLSTTGTNPNETYVGTMVVEGNIQVGGTLQQFLNQDAWQGSAGQYNLIVKRNVTTNDSSAFVVFFGGAANFGDILGEVTVEGNSLANTGGKGVIGLDASSLISFRSSPLTVHVPTPNTLSSTTWASNWAEAPGSSGNTVGYRTTTISPPSIAQDTVSPVIPPEPATPAPSPSFEYVLTPGNASTVVPGIIQLATDAEVQAGTDTSNKAVNPASLQSKLSDSVNLASSTSIASSQAVKDSYDAALSAQADADQALLDAAAAQATADQAVLDAASAQATADAAMPKSGGNFTGPISVTPDTDSATAVQFKNSAGTPVLTIDTVTPGVVVGYGATSYTLPPADGTANYLLTTDGAGTLSWTAGSADVWQESGGTVSLVTPGQNLSLDIGELKVNGDAGAFGFVLTSSGPGAPPVWVTAGGGGAGGVLQFADFASFPALGDPDILYVAQDTQISYYWDDPNTQYVRITTTPGSLTEEGVLQLEDSTSSTSVTTAATPNSVKGAYDLANAALPLTGGQMTGTILLNGVNPVPAAPNEPTSKFYVDQLSGGLRPQEAVRVATTAAIGGVVTYSNGTDGVGATLTLDTALSTIDGVSRSAATDRVLVKNQENAAHNGIYVWTTTTLLTRATDSDTVTELPSGALYYVTSGTTNRGTSWAQYTTVTTIGTDPLSYTLTSGANFHKYSKEWNVDPVGGDDTNGTGSEEQPFLTIGRALTAAGNTGERIVLHQGIYVENITLGATDLNLDIVGANRSGATINGTVTFTGASSSVRVYGVQFLGNITHSGTGGVYFDECTLNTGVVVTKSGNGYLQFFDVEANTSSFSVTGAGYFNVDDSRIGPVTVNNASAVFTAGGCPVVGAITVTAGFAVVDGSNVFSTGETTDAINGSATSTVFLKNSTCFTPSGTSARVTLAGVFTLDDALFDKDNSTLSGTLSTTQARFGSIDLLSTSNSLSIAGPITLPVGGVGAAGQVLTSGGPGVPMTWTAGGGGGGGGTVDTVVGVLPVVVDSTDPANLVVSVNAGSTSVEGVLKLTNSVSSTLTTTAATPNSVKVAYDLAAGALQRTGGTLVGSLFSTPLQTPSVVPAANQLALVIDSSNGQFRTTSFLDAGTY
jgi:hypothetical protein